MSLLVRCPGGSKYVYTNTNGTMDKCPDYQSVLISEVSELGCQKIKDQIL